MDRHTKWVLTLALLCAIAFAILGGAFIAFQIKDYQYSHQKK
jgi:hypothetical protein